MKIVARLLIFLLAAAVVIGATYAFSQTAAARSLPGTLGGRGGFEGRGGFPGELSGDPNQLPNNSNATGRGNRSGSFPGGSERGPRGGDFDRDLGNLSSVVLTRNLALIAGVILSVQVVRIGWRKLKPGKA
jgi:hypothetical protein